MSDRSSALSWLGPQIEMLREAGLLDVGLARSLRDHSADFPEETFHKLFLELALAPTTGVAGWGHGFPPERLRALLDARPRWPAVQRIEDALRLDPFRPEALVRADGDVEWVEYDVDGDEVKESPAVFFEVPDGARRLRGSDVVARLAEATVAHAQWRGGSLEALLLRAATWGGQGIGHIYRLGLSQERAPGWLRLVIGGMSLDDAEALLSSGFDDVDVTLPRALEDTVRRHSSRPMKIALSLDALHGTLVAADIECPHFCSVERAVRRPTEEAALASLSTRGFDVGALEAGVRWTPTEVGGHRSVVLLNHLKHGVAGRTTGRLKAYLEILAWRRDRPAPRVARPVTAERAAPTRA